MYIYIVTRVVRYERPGCTSVPNLGVHTNLKKALSHFDVVVADRVQFKSQHHWTIGERNDRTQRKIIKTAYFTLPDGSKEELMLERWKLGIDRFLIKQKS